MKRIVLCFDGTWNRPADEGLDPDEQIETNVSRFYRSVASIGLDGVEQEKWYDQGVGTHWYDRFSGGVLGLGLEKNILDGYAELVRVYEDGDEVYLLGFSRGAYTARSLVGMIRNCGLVRPSLASWRIYTAYGIYRMRDDGPDSSTAVAFRRRYGREISIRFLGVWDTVGALGIPLDVAERLNDSIYEFHDTQLSGIVERAYHAVALDEHRQDYDVCLWDPDEAPEQTIEQRWFCGAHADVGGGYDDRRLSDLSLAWMQERATAAGLGLNALALGADSHLGPISDSYADFLGGRYAQLRPRHFRPVLATPFGGEVLDATIGLRRGAGIGYQPANPNLPPLGG